MLKNWLNSVARQPCPYQKFQVTEITELQQIDLSNPFDENVTYIGRLLVEYHGDPQLIADDLAMLAQDSGSVGLNLVKEYIEKRILPKPTANITRIGNWGEILASQCMVEFNEYSFPVYKLRFREKRNWAMRLTDLFLIKFPSSGNPIICYGEVKTRSKLKYGKRVKRVAIEAHDSLKKDDALTDPEILTFLRSLLYLNKRRREALFLGQIQNRLTPYEVTHMLFLVHESEIWKEEILEELEKHQIDNRLQNLSVVILRVTNLGQLIDIAYQNAWRAVEASYG